jgi:hypothetical protein
LLAGVSQTASAQNLRVTKTSKRLEESGTAFLPKEKSQQPLGANALRMGQVASTVMIAKKMWAKNRKSTRQPAEARVSSSSLPLREMSVEEVGRVKELFGSTFQDISESFEEIRSRRTQEDAQGKDPKETAADIEAERRRLQAERKRLREKVEAASPKKRIQLRKEDLIEDGVVLPVPMKKHGFGQEKDEVVDVARIQTKLNPGKSVRQMVNRLAEQEKTMTTFAPTSEPPNYVRLNKRNMEQWKLDAVIERRIELAQQEEEHVMFVRTQYRALQHRERARRELLAGRPDPALQLGGKKRGQMSELMASATVQLLQQRWLEALTCGQILGELATRYSNECRLREEAQKRALEKEMSQGTVVARRKWRLVMRVLRVWLVLSRLRQKKRSVHVVTKFLNSLGESARIKVNVSRALKRVKHIQKEARAYQQRRRVLLQDYTKQWIRVEEKHLLVAYKEVSKRLVAENRERLAREAKQKGGVAMKRVSEGFIDFKPNPSGWKNYRMDADKRYKALSGELTRRVRHFVKSTDNWVSATRDCLKNQVELSRFMKSLGAIPASQEEIEDVVVPPEVPAHDWYTMTDEDMLAFIMYSGGGIQHPSQAKGGKLARAPNPEADRDASIGKKGPWPPSKATEGATGTKKTVSIAESPLDQYLNSPRLTFEEDAAVEEDKFTHPALEEATASAWRAAGP